MAAAPVEVDESPTNGTTSGRVALKHASDSELREWMAQRRDRCEVLESVPVPTTADFQSTAPKEQINMSECESSAAPQEQIHSASQRSASEELRQHLQLGPLTHSERLRLWPGCLARKGSAVESVPHGLLELLDPRSHLDEEVLFDSREDGEVKDADAAAGAATEQASHLAEMFSKEHFRWLSGWQSSGQEDPNKLLFTAISQLLKYHFPRVASAMNAIATAGGGNLTSMLCSVCTSCGMSVDYKDMILDMSIEGSPTYTVSADKTALLLLCDLVTLEGQDLLLPFVVLALLSELLPKSGCEFEDLEDSLRSAVTLTALAGRQASDVSTCVSHAITLLNTTPVSLTGAFRGERSDVWFSSPACMVTPEEVLQHTHEGPPGAWRLIIVDARMRKSQLALPVGVRLDPARHSHRLQILQDMPVDDAVHLCLVGDGAPGRGDEAFELYLCLCGKGSWRKHVSIVEGGWPAVEATACTLKLDLMPTMTDVNWDQRKTEEAVSGMSEARAVAAEVAEQVAVATEKVSAVAQFAVSGASRALVYLDGRWGAGSVEEGEGVQEARRPAEGEAESAQSGSAWSLASRAIGLWGSRSEDCEQAAIQSAEGCKDEEPPSEGIEGPQSSARSKASRMFNYLDGLWSAGSTEREAEVSQETQLPAEEEAREGPQFRGSG